MDTYASLDNVALHPAHRARDPELPASCGRDSPTRRRPDGSRRPLEDAIASPLWSHIVREALAEHGQGLAEAEQLRLVTRFLETPRGLELHRWFLDECEAERCL